MWRGNGGDPNQVEGEDSDGETFDINQVMTLVDEWTKEVVDLMEVEEEEWGAWDDVNGCELPIGEVVKARLEEIGFMNKRGQWDPRPRQECFDKTGKSPVSVRWVDTNKGNMTLGEMIVRSRLVARDFKGNDRGRDDLFAETPPLEAKRMLFSRAATMRSDRRWRKLMFIDVRKAHLNPVCEEDVYIEFPEECGYPKDVYGKLNYWLYGFRKAGVSWENHYSGKFEEVGFHRGVTCGVCFYHMERDLSLVVHGDDFTFCGLEEDLIWIKELMESWYEIKFRGILGGGREGLQRDDHFGKDR